MGTAFSLVKSLIIPAVIALILFLVSTYVLLPLWRHYRNRYSHYLPLDTISNGTMSLRARVQGAIARWLVPSRWRMGGDDRFVVETYAGSELGDSSEEGEELGDLHGDPRHALSLDANEQPTDRRLSRDLEAGFRDDSDDEEDGTRQRGR